MDVNPLVSAEKENAAIDMNVCMVVDDLTEILHKPEEKILYEFLKSRTCSMLYDRGSKLWWDGPSVILEQYLEEIKAVKE